MFTHSVSFSERWICGRKSPISRKDNPVHCEFGVFLCGNCSTWIKYWSSIHFFCIHYSIFASQILEKGINQVSHVFVYVPNEPLYHEHVASLSTFFCETLNPNRKIEIKSSLGFFISTESQFFSLKLLMQWCINSKIMWRIRHLSEQPYFHACAKVKLKQDYFVTQKVRFWHYNFNIHWPIGSNLVLLWKTTDGQYMEI